jgi:hypothetical protein
MEARIGTIKIRNQLIIMVKGLQHFFGNLNYFADLNVNLLTSLC